MTTSVGSGLGGSLGFAKETAWGVHTAPTRWCEIDSETIEWKPKRIVGKGLAAGNIVQRSATRQQVTSTVEGEIKTGVYYKGMGLLLGSLMGTLGAAVVSGVQTHSLISNTAGQGLTIQKGVPQLGGLIVPYSYQGCKVVKGMFEFASDDFVKATFTVDGQKFDVAGHAYTPPVYQAPNPIHSFNTSSLFIGAFGSESIVEGIRKATLTIERPMRVDNFYMDGTAIKSEQIINDFVKITLDLESDYISDAAFCQQFALDTQASVILGSTAGSFGFEAFMPSMRWESGPPMLSGPDLVQPKLQLIGLFDDVNNPAILVYTSSDTTQ